MLDGADRGCADEAAGDIQKGRPQGEVRGRNGTGTVRRQGATASEKDDRGAGGSKE